MSELHRWTQDGIEWVCAAYDHGPFCRLCQQIGPDDETAHAMLDGVASGQYTVTADRDGTLLFKLTDEGIAYARSVVIGMGYDPDDPESFMDAAREMVRRPDTN